MLRALLGLCLAGLVGSAEAADLKLLVVLQDTGRVDHGLPVVVAHPDAARIEAALNHGFSARLMRLDHMVQQRLFSEGKGPAPEPDYLVLGERQGGFPEQGFVLNGRRQPLSRWVDLPQSQALTGNWGAMDQIFPHELAHVVMARLSTGKADHLPIQIHAVGVRTSPSIAYQEGFAEHIQIMALDDPGVDPASAALLHDPYWTTRVGRHLAAYRRELEASVSVGSPMRMTFPLWYGNDEQVLRYHAVKENAFARRPLSTAASLDLSDHYRAYLLDRSLPGASGGEPRTVQQMMETEGVISHIVWRWVNSPEMGRQLAPPHFYASYGTEGRDLAPVENMYLKIFAAAQASQANDLPALIKGYEALFPAERVWLEALLKKALLGQTLRTAPNLWLANPEAPVGTSLFDQWRARPRPNCFDLNAADAADLASLPGVSTDLAQAIQNNAPYASLQDLKRVPGMTAEVEARLQSYAIRPMHHGSDEKKVVGAMQPVLLSYLWRMLAIWAAAAGLGVLTLRIIEPWSYARASWRALLGSGLGLVLTWLGPLGLAGGIWIALAMMATPTALWRLRRKVAMRIPLRRELSFLHPSLRGILAWAALLAPAWLLVHPW